MKLLCERRAGELLSDPDLRNRGAGGPGRKKSKRATLAALLKRVGIAETTAKRWQLLARVPVSEFQEWLAEANAMEDEELTTSRA